MGSDNVVQPFAKPPRGQGSVAKGGGGGDDGGMDARIKALEDLTKTVSTDVAVIKSNYATREDLFRATGDLHKTINDQTWKLITWTTGLGAALVAATYFLARHIP
jgi:hypothetical protein